MIIYDEKKKIFVSTLINDSQYFSGFGTKFFGDARLIKNILQALRFLSVSYKTIVVPGQIHSTNIQIYDGSQPINIKKIEDTDGLITQIAETVLIVLTGDCVPVIYCDKKKGAVGISHQGWRGSLKKMVQKMIFQLIDLGCQKEDIFVAIGPSIGACCYDIDDERYYTFLTELDGYSEKIFSYYRGKRYLNLPLLNYLLLVEAGVPKKNIDIFPFCTKCDSHRFFSFRRKKDYGEMMSFIVKKV